MKGPRGTRITQAGARGLSEAILAGPSSGCNRFTVRRITLSADGRTARAVFELGVVYFVHSGKIALSHGNGELDHLGPGEAAVIHPGEANHLQNVYTGSSLVIAVIPQ